MISGGAGKGNRMKCRRCRAPAVIELRRHNAAFCQDCFLHYVHEQVRAGRQGPRHARTRRTGSWWRCPAARTRSRCGTSCSTWATTPRACTSGSGSATTRTARARSSRAFAEERGAELIHVDLRDEYGYDIPTAGKKGSRSTCAVCGLSKRYVFNRAALEHGFDVVATGHNLDDEAATLLGNTLRWQTEYIARQFPVAARARGHGEEGQAAAPAVRAGDGRVRVPARHRLRRRGVPAGRRATPSSSTRTR